MNDAQAKPRGAGLAFECDFDEPPEKVWRALSIPELRENWLPREALADAQAHAVVPGREIQYRMREDAAPYLESTVTFTVEANEAGGSRLRIVHDLCDALKPKAANSNDRLMLAA